ncbi:MAG: hypothetical protein JWP01_3639 [Myxococcales bacterium]|nr:hypothetical protein [Myxococcales bacterium]
MDVARHAPRQTEIGRQPRRCVVAEQCVLDAIQGADELAVDDASPDVPQHDRRIEPLRSDRMVCRERDGQGTGTGARDLGE